MIVAVDRGTGKVLGQVLPMPVGGRGSAPGWLRVLTRDGVRRVLASAVRLEKV